MSILLTHNPPTFVLAGWQLCMSVIWSSVQLLLAVPYILNTAVLSPFPLCSPKTSLRAGGTHLVVLARSIAAYLQVALDVGDLDRAARTFNQQTTKTLMTIFK